jgi:DNA-binding SARP family transcriptional activator/tetratricopeptide (TPR) repeat protein
MERTSRLQFLILGPLEAWSQDQPLALGGSRQRALLAVLLLHAGQVVPTSRLIEDLWGEKPPSGAAGALWVQVARLRKALDPGRQKGAPDTRLVTRPSGYLLRVDPGELDLDRFDSLVARGRQALAGGAPQDATRLLGQALALWRGPSLGDLAGEPFARGHVVRLEELRWSAVEDRIDAELACGRHGELVGEIEAVVAADPLRERPRGQLMLALYRSGRQADALSAYREARTVLVEGLGIEPGPGLQRLQRAILTQDPALEWAPPAAPARLPSGGAAARPPEVPVDVEPVAESRRTVTVLRAGITASAAVGTPDLESLGPLEDHYLEQVRLVLARHGGMVQQLATEAVTAVFGVPSSHEDDPVRAVRAAAELRTVVEQVSDGLGGDRAPRLSLSAGVETGEVLVRSRPAGPAALTGGVPRLAMRLEQAAAPGEILLGATAYGLVRDAVSVHEGPALRPDGADVPQFSWRLVAVEPRAPGRVRNLDAPMVGRSRERSHLRHLLERTVADRACQLVTVVGPAGIGKSRLVHELLSTAGADAALPPTTGSGAAVPTTGSGAAVPPTAGSGVTVPPTAGSGVTVLRGRCLDYDDGVTLWPVAEVVRQAGGVTEATTAAELLGWLAGVLDGEPDATAVAEQLAGLLGLTERAPPVRELPWAVRKLVECLARRKPLVVVLDDLHWAEPALFDLLEYLADTVRGVPVLLCCIARSELFETRHDWQAGRTNATRIDLDPLSGAECAALVDNLLGGDADPSATRRLCEVADGNPLFLEELVAMLIEDGVLVSAAGSWVTTTDLTTIPVPPSISALLAARLDRLAPGERAVIERASVIGKVFYREAVVELAPDSVRPAVDAYLLTLTAKELIRPGPSDFPGERAYWFRHLLIRDAAYAAMPKRRRAELHERFAGWLDARASDPYADTDEFAAYHLERACKHRAELGLTEPGLVRRTGARLAAAGQRAGDRLDHRAASTLLTRALALLPDDDPAGLELVPALVTNLAYQGELLRARSMAAEAIEWARMLGRWRLEARLRVEQQMMTWTSADAWAADEARAELERAIPVFEQVGDGRGLAAAWLLVARLEFQLLRCAAVEDPVERSVRHSQAVGDAGRVRQALNLLGSAYLHGPTPVREAIRRWRALEREAGENRIMHATARSSVAWLEAMRGEFARAEALLQEAGAILQDMAPMVGWIPRAIHREHTAYVASLRGDHARAEASLRAGRPELEAAGASGVLSTEAALLADVLYEQGRYAEAGELTHLSAGLTVRRDDLGSQVLWRSVRSKVLARQGRVEEALWLSAKAVTLAERTDALNIQASAWRDRAVVLEAAGRAMEARPALERAEQRWARKGNLVAAEHARRLLSALVDDPAGRPHAQEG